MTIKTTPNPITIPRASISISREDNTKSQLTSSTKAVINHPAILPKSILKKSSAQQKNATTEPQHVTFSEHRTVKEFHKSIQEQVNLQAKTIDPKKLIKTESKTVHFKQLNKLSANVTDLIKFIGMASNDINARNELTSNSRFFEVVQQKLVNLTDSITHYKGDLVRSSYDHHKSKPITLAQLDDKIKQGTEMTDNLKIELIKNEKFAAIKAKEQDLAPKEQRNYYDISEHINNQKAKSSKYE
ncbi:hypothetical protein [Providencia heimbachae]|uniref:Uncharacterized protein n=1 Tax=Providencia heimbachae ATCC 35613 TaxID=1354272 RepID=A0A1B7K036_9GAMM|nr:hypothetical protein [Providencia heimbachae]OAT53354.1 hypothetical protein M998_1042 [Providencia heimbachae ATCC 35613]QCJ70977.1 hypothetical protein C9446_14640 [Providencia heimbachae]SQH14091.1 Uncharacterised protein [Providencia heimbachae]